MSWDVSLEDEIGLSVAVPRHTEGGMYPLGGTTEAELSVTYNYGARFREVWPEPLPDRGALVGMLNGRRAEETILPLEAAVGKLGTVRTEDYWEATPGNAGHALNVLLAWARLHPAATWSVH